jgi:outer membrane protein assembly factor BamB/plastocyanin
MTDVQLSRRRLIGAASAAGFAAAAGGFALTGGSLSNRARAQDDVEDQGPATPTPLGEPVPQEFGTETNWPYENYDLSATRDVKGTSISAETVGQLGDAWFFPVSGAAAFGSLTANPTIVDGVVYVQDASANVYALDMASGQQIWANMYNDVVPSGGPNGTANAYGLLYTTIGGIADVVCLRPESGEEVWRTNIQGPMKEGITTAPLVHNNRVFVSTIPGTSEAFYQGGYRGVIHVLDAATGAVMWYFDTTTDNLWGNPTVNSGGGFWHPPSVDEEGKIYVGIGNPGPYPGVEGWPWASSRPGDNLYTDAILKFDPETATLDWYYQVLPHDVFDLDNQLTPILAEVDGRGVVFTSGKHGVVVCLDRESGEVVWRVEVGTHENYDRTEFEEDEVVEVWPGTIGGVETQFAFSAEHNLLVCPVVELASTYIGTGFDPSVEFDLFAGRGLLVALNPADGSTAWQVDLATPPYAAATICNDVVFTSGLDGLVLGFNIADGSEVFRYQASAGVNAQLAVSGDHLIVPAGGPLIPSDSATNQPSEMAQGVIALMIGGTVQATPESGAGEEATPEDQEATPEAGSGGGDAVEVDMVDLAFQPNTFTIPANMDVEATFHNKGALPHNWTCDALGLKTPDVPAGESASLTINAAAGSYDFICSIPGHADAGMVGTLTVE